MNSQSLPPDALKDALDDARERGRKYRERGGSFVTGISKIDYDPKRKMFTIVYFPARYPTRKYGADGVLIPEEPFIPDGANIRGFEHVSLDIALRAFASGIEALNSEAREALETLLRDQKIISPEQELHTPMEASTTAASLA